MKDKILEIQLIRNQGSSELPQNVFRLPHGLLYARWFVLSALFDVCIYFCLYIIPFQPGLLHVLRDTSTFGFIEQCLLIGCILVTFLLGSVIAFLIGYRYLEMLQDAPTLRRGLRGFLWFLSDFEKLNRKHWPLLIGIAFIMAESVYALCLKIIRPIPLALALISLVLTIWVCCNKTLRGRFEQPEPLDPKEIRKLSAGYLFLCVFRLHLFTRKTANEPVTTIVGMQQPPPTEYIP